MGIKTLDGSWKKVELNQLQLQFENSATDITCIFLEDSLDDIIKVIQDRQYTRYPICTDNKDNIIGFMHIKALYKQQIQGDKNIKDIIRKVKFVPKWILWEAGFICS